MAHPTYVASLPQSANLAAARGTHWDFFNAVGSDRVVRIVGLYMLPSLVAVTGVGLTWELLRTTAIGTGGTAVVPAPVDTTSEPLSSQITVRSKPTGGATSGPLLLRLNSSSEETIPFASVASTINFALFGGAQNITIREGEGVKIDQTTSSSVGTTGWTIAFHICHPSCKDH